MDFIIEFNKAIESGLQAFIDFIKQSKARCLTSLERSYWVDGVQMYPINYLIQQYNELPNNTNADANRENLAAMIDHVITDVSNKNMGCPIHQLISTNKIQLALQFLREKKKTTRLDTSSSSTFFDLNQRNVHGQTLLCLAINSKNEELLTEILSQNPDIFASSILDASGTLFQPLHQCILLDFAKGVSLLISKGAQLSNPVGKNKETPVLLAAGVVAVNALETLLSQPLTALNMDAKHLGTGYNAIEILCKELANSKNRKRALQGVAMLLCHGAEAPSDDAMRELLRSNRKDLLKMIDVYLEPKPELVDDFVKRCHLTQTALHNIIYSQNSWESSIRRFFGRPSGAAFVVENLVSRKNHSVSSNIDETKPTSSIASQAAEHNALKLYSEFVRRYKLAYNGQMISNCWSSMRWLIASGLCDWSTVERYAKTNPKSRTSKIYKEMMAASFLQPTEMSEVDETNLADFAVK